MGRDIGRVGGKGEAGRLGIVGIGRKGVWMGRRGVYSKAAAERQEPAMAA